MAWYRCPKSSQFTEYKKVKNRVVEPSCDYLDAHHFLVSLFQPISEIPLLREFRYNSVVFSSLSINDISVTVATKEFLTVSDWTASKLGNSSDNLMNPNFKAPIPEKTTTSNDAHDIHGNSSWYQSLIDELYTDYHKDPSQYRNHSIYECLKAYKNPFEWRPFRLILITSDTHSFLHLNNSILLQWEIIRPNAETHGYPLCFASSPSFRRKCVSLASFNSENIGTYTYYGNKIDYALYKDTDPIRTNMKKCYLHGSPQILMGMYVCILSIHCITILTKDLI